VELTDPIVREGEVYQFHADDGTPSLGPGRVTGITGRFALRTTDGAGIPVQALTSSG
jgi:hypothetical protein